MEEWVVHKSAHEQDGKEEKKNMNKMVRIYNCKWYNNKTIGKNSDNRNEAQSWDQTEQRKGKQVWIRFANPNSVVSNTPVNVIARNAFLETMAQSFNKQIKHL